MESRTAPLSVRLRRLSEEAAERAVGKLGAMCRALVETLAAEVRDDVALLGVRLR